MHIGYVPVSTRDQDLRLQYDALREAQCDKIDEDKVSSAKASREGLKFVLETVRKRDRFLMWKLDRLGRSEKDMVNIVCDLEQHGIHFKSLTDQIDTSTTAGRFFFHVMASLAEMGWDLTVERTRAGLDAARQGGRTGGCKRKMIDLKISAAKQLLQDGISPREVAKTLGMSIPTLYRWLPATTAVSADDNTVL